MNTCEFIRNSELLVAISLHIFGVSHKKLKLPLEKRNPYLSHSLFELKTSHKKGLTFLDRANWTKLFVKLELI